MNLLEFDKSMIYYSIYESALSSDLGSNLTVEIKRLKDNLGLLVDDFQV